MQEKQLAIQQAQNQALKEVQAFESKLLQINSTDQTISQEIVYESGRNSSDWLVDFRNELIYLPCQNKVLVHDIKRKKYYRSFDHHGAIEAVEMTSDGKIIITAGNHIKIWDMKNGKCLHTIKTVPFRVKSMYLSLDDHYLLSSDCFGGFSFWDLQTGILVYSESAETPHSTEKARHFAISPDNQQIAISSLNKLEIIESFSGKRIASITDDFFSGFSNPIVYHPKGHFLICSSFMNPEIGVFDPHLNMIWKSSIGESRFGTTKLRIAQNGENLIVVNNYTCLRLWNLSHKKHKVIDGNWADARFGNDERSIYAHGYDTNIKVWDLDTVQPLRTIELGSLNSPFDLAHRPNSNTFIQSLPDKKFRFCQLDSATQSQKIEAPHEYFTNFQFSPSGKHFISADNFVIRVWDYAQKKCIRKFSTHWINHCRSISSDDSLLAYAANDEVFIKEIQTGFPVLEISGIKTLKGLTFCDQEDLMYTVEGDQKRRVRSWSISTSACQQDFVVGNWFESKTDKNSIRYPDRVLFDSARKRCFTSDEDLNIRLWDLTSGQCLHTFSGHQTKARPLAIHPNGEFLISADEQNHILIWDLINGKFKREIVNYPPYISENRITSIHFSANNQVVFIYNQDKTIRFHDFQTGELLGCLNTLNDGWLWTTPPDKYAKNGWLYTNRLDLVSFSAIRNEHLDEIDFLSDADEQVVNFLKLYNDKDMVLARIFDKKRYLEMAETRINVNLNYKQLPSREFEIRLLLSNNRNQTHD